MLAMIELAAQTEHGYLVLADISGFTSYLAGVELEHANDILSDLMEAIVAGFETLLSIAKLEGDAVFAYVSEARVPRGETLVELLESTYVAFCDRRDAVRRRTTCRCNACRFIPQLELKFMAHYGDYVLQRVMGRTELLGSDVNLAHRLLKNHVAEATGWRAYALFSAQCLSRLGLPPADMGAHEQVESFDALGEVTTYSVDLRPRYAALLEARRVLVAPGEAHHAMTSDMPVSPPVLWSWLNEATRRARWEEHDSVQADFRPGGRTGAGARNHCVHGKDLVPEIILDWRPFEYFTVEQLVGEVRITITHQLEPLSSDETRLHTRIRLEQPLPAGLDFPSAVALLKTSPAAKWHPNLRRMLQEEVGSSGTAA
jgi:class 3 adenylate cyclase